MESLWLQTIDWMIQQRANLPQVWPQELPPEGTPDFWFHSARLEMQTRHSVSALLERLVDGEEACPISPLEGWMIQRRFEWAGQVVMSKVLEGIEPPIPLPELLLWALIQTWLSDGCIGFWQHAERGGKMHPKWAETFG